MPFFAVHMVFDEIGDDEVCICFFPSSDHLFKILCDEAVVGIQHFHVLSSGRSQSDVDA